MKYANNTHVNEYNPSLDLSGVSELLFKRPTLTTWISEDGRFGIARVNVSRTSCRWVLTDHKLNTEVKYLTLHAAKDAARKLSKELS